MNNKLNLKNKFFLLLKNHKKTIELRLYDEKRKIVKTYVSKRLICKNK